MNWRIESKPVDVYELSDSDVQSQYLVYVLDDCNQPIEASYAYGIADRTAKTRMYTAKYGRYIVKIEHK